jgi:prevent-host-death family protein
VKNKTTEMKVASSEVKAGWHDYLDQVSREHRVIVVTRYGRPIARLVPHQDEDGTGIFGALAGTVRIHGDIVAPIDEQWSADE